MDEGKVLDTSVLIAGASGLTTIFGIIEYPPALGRCTILFPDQPDFERAIDLASQLRLKGTTIGCVDIVIASMCINRGLKLSTKDKDYKYIKDVEKNFQLELIS